MKSIKLPPSRIERAETVTPTVMIGQCVFAARGKVSMIRVSNQPAEDMAVDILTTQIITKNPPTPDTLSIWAPNSEKRKIVLCADHMTRATNFLNLSLQLHDTVPDDLSGMLVLKESRDGSGFSPSKINKILNSVSKIHTLILPVGNRSVQPNNPLQAEETLVSLNRFARGRKISIILLYNQWNSTGKPKNGSFIGVAEKHFFSIAKLTYTSHPDSYYLESYRAQLGHDFWPISVTSDEFGNPVHVGIERNRVPFK